VETTPSIFAPPSSKALPYSTAEEVSVGRQIGKIPLAAGGFEARKEVKGFVGYTGEVSGLILGALII
jgi:hypothetical protein